MIHCKEKSCEKELDWFIIIKFVPKMSKQIKHVGYVCLVVIGYNCEMGGMEPVQKWVAAL